MRLPAMMRLVLEEMRQHVVAAILLDTPAAVDIDNSGEAIFIEPVDKGDQHLVKLCLGALQRQHVGKGFLYGKGGQSQCAALQRIDIKAVDSVDMIERRTQRREETDAAGNKRLLRKLETGLMQPVIGEPVVARKFAENPQRIIRHRHPSRNT